MKRTPEEILKKIESVKDMDFMGFKTSDFIIYLPFSYAKPFLKEGVKKSDWKVEKKTPQEKIKDYMEFAWDKANGCRGLSAARSMSHMEAWLWLAGEDQFLKDLEDIEYQHYGKEKLIHICNKYNIDWQSYDDGIRTNTDTG